MGMLYCVLNYWLSKTFYQICQPTNSGLWSKKIPTTNYRLTSCKSDDTHLQERQLRKYWKILQIIFRKANFQSWKKFSGHHLSSESRHQFFSCESSDIILKSSNSCHHWVMWSSTCHKQWSSTSVLSHQLSAVRCHFITANRWWS